MFGSLLGELPELVFGDCLSSVRNILHGPALSFGFSSLRPNLEIKPQEKTVQQFGLQSIRRAGLSYSVDVISSLSF